MEDIIKLNEKWKEKAPKDIMLWAFEKKSE